MGDRFGDRDPVLEYRGPHVMSLSGDTPLSVRIGQSETAGVSEIDKTPFGYFLVKNGLPITLLKDTSNPSSTKWTVTTGVIDPNLFKDRILEQVESTSLYEPVSVIKEDFNSPCLMITDPLLINIASIEIVNPAHPEFVRTKWGVYVGKYPPIEVMEKHLLYYTKLLPEFTFVPKKEHKTTFGYQFTSKIEGRTRQVYVVEESKLRYKFQNPGTRFYYDYLPEEVRLLIKSPSEQ